MLGSLTRSQYLPGSSWLHRLDARCKLGLLIWGTCLAFSARVPATAMPLAAGFALLPLSARLPRSLWLGALAPLLPLLLVGMLFQAFWGPAPRWSGVSLSGVESAGWVGLHLVELALLAQTLALTTSPIALCDAAEFWLRPLRRLGLPHRDLALALTIAWRFVPVLAGEGVKLLKAQQARGAAWDAGPWWKKLSTLGGLLAPLTMRCFRYADELALALEARGYGLTENPTRLHPPRWGWLDSCSWLACAALLSLILLAQR